MNRIGNVYIITNTINNKVYIGQTIRNIRQRFSEHMSLHQRGNAHLKSAVLKYGKESFNIEILKTLETNNEDELFKFLYKWEKYYIKKYKSYDSEFGYNIDFGGQLNRVVSDESRKKMSESHKGVKLSLERIEKQREYMKNHPERWIDPIHNVGKQLSEEHKRKISEAQKGEKGNM